MSTLGQQLHLHNPGKSKQTNKRKSVRNFTGIHALPIRSLRLVSTPHCAAVCSFLPITSFPLISVFPFRFYNNSDITFPLCRDKWLCGPLLSPHHPSEKNEIPGRENVGFAPHLSILSRGRPTPRLESTYTVQELKGSSRTSSCVLLQVGNEAKHFFFFLRERERERAVAFYPARPAVSHG